MKAGKREDLQRTLMRIDGRGYRAYQDIRGRYDVPPYQMEIAHVQGDPYAPPSRVHLGVELAHLGPASLAEGAPERRRALEDFLGRAVATQIRRRDTREIAIDRFGQEILLRSAVRLRGDEVEFCLFVHLPAAGRRIRARQAERILLEDLPELLDRAIAAPNLDCEALWRHQDIAEDHAALLAHLAARGWVGFVANGAILPRRAGSDDRPLQPGEANPVIAFQSPPQLEQAVDLPHAGCLRGMAIPRGVTLLVGGGFHGKSTLLEALTRGIYAHIPGDGREQVAADPLAVKVRAEDGRAVTCSDISPFIGQLPYGRSTDRFTTQNASGSTSQAANIVEALDAGARVLLLDEDTSATNFMIRDEPMRRLLKPGQEPITPFLDRVRSLYRDRGVSTVLVVGGSGEYFRVADRVIQMDRYLPTDVTARAQAIAPPEMAEEAAFPQAGPERLMRLDDYRRRAGPRGARVKVQGRARLVVEREEVDLGACEQLVSISQTRTLAEILARLLEGDRAEGAWGHLAGGFTTDELSRMLAGWGEELLDHASRYRRGDLAAVRPLEVVALLNRLRDLQVCV